MKFLFELRVILTAWLMLLALSATAGDYFEKDGLALRGYDPVSYFTTNKPQPGVAAHAHTYKGSTFHFATEENRKLFAADPGKYAPQFGGFCAFGASRGYKVSTQPDAFAVVNGKLYLNYNTDIRKQWQSDVPGNIAKAEATWPEVSKTPQKD